MQAMKKTIAALVALTGMTGQLAAAPSCATVDDMAAFRTAAVQQQLMVAALTCHDVEAYNRFVLAYRPELQKSDADLKSYFKRQGSEAAYDTFKTKLANLSSLSDIANGPAYCANAGSAFDIALRSRQALSSFVADQRLMIAMPQQTLCASRPIQASVSVPEKVAKLTVLPARPQPLRLAAAAPAEAAPMVSVPSHDLPAMPYGASGARAAAASYARQEAAYDQADQARSDQQSADNAPPAYAPSAYDRPDYTRPEYDRPNTDRAAYDRDRAVNNEDYDEDDLPPPPPRPARPRMAQAQRYSPYDETYQPRRWQRDYDSRWYPEDER